jgi:HNH endonuclease
MPFIVSYKNQMTNTYTGPRHHRWKGGRRIATSGYVSVRVGKAHHLSDSTGYAYEHRVVAEQKIGRRLKPREEVHHIDGNKTNNSPDNLEVFTIRVHRSIHRRPNSKLRLPGQLNPTIICGCGCGKTLKLFDKFGRPRHFIYRHSLGRGKKLENKFYPCSP